MVFGVALGLTEGTVVGEVVTFVVGATVEVGATVTFVVGDVVVVVPVVQPARASSMAAVAIKKPSFRFILFPPDLMILKQSDPGYSIRILYRFTLKSAEK